MSYQNIDTPGSTNTKKFGPFDLATSANQTIQLPVLNPRHFIGTEAIELQLIITGANANADSLVVRGYNSLVELPETPVYEGVPSVEYTYVFNTGNDSIAVPVDAKNLAWLYLEIEVPAAADAGDVELFVKTKQN